MKEHELPIIKSFPIEYIGDSVYIRFDGYSFVIYTDNGNGAENEIYLEPDMIEEITNYADKVRETIKAVLWKTKKGGGI